MVTGVTHCLSQDSPFDCLHIEKAGQPLKSLNCKSIECLELDSVFAFGKAFAATAIGALIASRQEQQIRRKHRISTKARSGFVANSSLCAAT